MVHYCICNALFSSCGNITDDIEITLVAAFKNSKTDLKISKCRLLIGKLTGQKKRNKKANSLYICFYSFFESKKFARFINYCDIQVNKNMQSLSLLFHCSVEYYNSFNDLCCTCRINVHRECELLHFVHGEAKKIGGKQLFTFAPLFIFNSIILQLLYSVESRVDFFFSDLLLLKLDPLGSFQGPRVNHLRP